MYPTIFCTEITADNRNYGVRNRNRRKMSIEWVIHWIMNTNKFDSNACSLEKEQLY